MTSQFRKPLLSFQTELQFSEAFSVPHLHCSEVKWKSFLKSFTKSESYKGQRTFHLTISGSLLAFVSHPYRKPTHSPTITCWPTQKKENCVLTHTHYIPPVHSICYSGISYHACTCKYIAHYKHGNILSFTLTHLVNKKENSDGNCVIKSYPEAWEGLIGSGISKALISGVYESVCIVSMHTWTHVRRFNSVCTEILHEWKL